MDWVRSNGVSRVEDDTLTIEELKIEHKDIMTVMCHIHKALLKEEGLSDDKMIELLYLLEWYHCRTECKLNELGYKVSYPFGLKYV